MASSGADDSVGGCCCIACTTIFESWCNQKSYGSGGSSKQAGCCNSCCSKSFDEDDFSNGRNAPKTASSQPAPQKPMSDKPAAVAAQPDSS